LSPRCPRLLTGVAGARARSLERDRDQLGDETETHLGSGAAMSYDELADYAIRQLDPQ
jgi:hypothetical protein